MILGLNLMPCRTTFLRFTLMTTPQQTPAPSCFEDFREQIDIDKVVAPFTIDELRPRYPGAGIYLEFCNDGPLLSQARWLEAILQEHFKAFLPSNWPTYWLGEVDSLLLGTAQLPKPVFDALQRKLFGEVQETISRQDLWIMGWALFSPQFEYTRFHELIKEWPIEMAGLQPSKGSAWCSKKRPRSETQR